MSKLKAGRILIPLDLSQLSLQALPLARQLAGRGSRVTLFHVVEPVLAVAFAYGIEGAAAPVQDPVLTRRLVLKSQAVLNKLARRIRRAKAVVKAGARPAKEIVAQAKRGCDLLVMSTHGRGGLSRLVYGSVAQKVLAHWKGQAVLLRPAARASRRRKRA